MLSNSARGSHICDSGIAQLWKDQRLAFPMTGSHCLPMSCDVFSACHDQGWRSHYPSSHQGLSHLSQQGSPVLCSSQEGRRAELLIVSVLKWEEWLTSHGITALLFPWPRPQGGAGCAKWVCSAGVLTGSSLYHPWTSARVSQKGLSADFLCWVHSSQRDFLPQPSFLSSLYPHFSLPLLSSTQG